MEQDLKQVHGYLPTLLADYQSGKVDRREFLRTSTLLGLSAVSAYALAGGPAEADPVTGNLPGEQIAAAGGGTVHISMRCPAIDNPATFSWIYDSNIVRQVCDYLTRTGADNVTRPWLLEKWEASDDVKTWTFYLKKGIKWSNGDELVADHVIWNLKRWVDPATGSSVLSFFKDTLLVEYDTGTKDDKGNPKMSLKLYDDKAIEKVDDHTFRLNGKAGSIAMPEALFHYPALILHPSENGKFGPNSIGTGAFTLTSYEVGKRAVLARRDGYWGNAPKLEGVEFIDYGDDASASLNALASKQVDAMYEAQTTQFAALKKIKHVDIKQVVTASTAVARMQEINDTWKDPRVRKAMRMALDTQKLLKIAYLGLGAPGEHHHVCKVHPEYADVGFMKQDIAGAKKLLADAGLPNGFDAELICKSETAWEPIVAQAMSQMWKLIGANIKITVLPGPQYWDIWTSPKAPFALTNWQHRPLGVMVLSLAYKTGVAWNESHWSNATFDKLIAQAEATLDVDKRRAIVADIEKLMLDEGPICLPLWRSFFTAVDKRVKGYVLHPSQYLFMEEWSLEA
jgi:peptide/nickel transport system substrate-binding protein